MLGSLCITTDMKEYIRGRQVWYSSKVTGSEAVKSNFAAHPRIEQTLSC